MVSSNVEINNISLHGWPFFNIYVYTTLYVRWNILRKQSITQMQNFVLGN